MYYDGNKMLSMQRLFNFIVGNRGAGKTYWFKDYAIRDFIKTGNQFVYVRRYKEELKKIGQFFNDIRDAYPEHEFEVKGKTFLIDKKVAGYALPLSTAKIEKSVAYPLVNKIGYDEFILDQGFYRYLNDEVTNFLELYETIARTRENVRAFFLSNALTVTNPYFAYFNIRLDAKRRFNKISSEILVELVQDEEFIKMKKATRFGKLIDGTNYGDYAIENKFLRDDDTFVEKKHGNPRFYCGFIYKGTTYGVWCDYQAGRLWVSLDYDKSYQIIYSMTLADHSPNTLLIKASKRGSKLREFIEYYKAGYVYFESINIKNVMYEMLKTIMNV